MTQAAPAANAAKKDEKKPETPKGETGKLPLHGGKDGITRTLDNKAVLKAPVDPKVKKAAEVLAGILDRKIAIDKEATEAGMILLKAFDESKKSKKCRIVGEKKTYWFSKGFVSKLVIEKKDANEA